MQSWQIIVSGFIIQLTFVGIHFSFGVFLKPVAEAFGWSRGPTSFAYTLMWWMASSSGILLGWLSDRVGARKVLVGGALIFSLGIFLSTTIQHLWQFYLYFGIIGGLGRAAAGAPFFAAVVPLVAKNKGLALSIILAGTSMGTMVFPPFARYLISVSDWQTAFYTLAITAVAIIVPAAFFLKGPEQAVPQPRLNPAVLPAGPHPQEGILPLPAGDWNTTNVLKNRYFWTLVVMGLACCSSHSLPLAHIVAFASDQGIDKLQAASLLGILGFTGLLGRLIWGVVSDRMGARSTLFCCILLQTIMLFWLSGAESLLSFYVLVSLFGLVYGGVLPLYPLVVREMFGLNRFGTVYGLQSVGTGFGMGAGGILGGFLFDAFGRYSPAFIISGAIGTVAIACAASLVFIQKKPQLAKTAK